MSLYEKIKKLEEDSRPTLYRALKYWGKKPHNVWRELVRVHTEKGNIVYDPFAGSALTFFECVKIGRKPVIADINPLTLFLVDLYSRDYDTQKILNRFSEIEKLVKNSMVYKKNYVSNCSNCGSEIDIYNFRHSGNDAVVAYSYKCPYCKNVVTQNNDIQEYYGSYNLWKPKKEISGFSSVCESSLKAFGGTNITDIWTNRNIEILSYIYDLIKLSSEDIKTPLMLPFCKRFI